MISRNNPAGRLAALLDRLASQFGPKDTVLLEAWMAAFGANESDPLGPHFDEHEVARLLRLALGEVSLVEDQISRRELGSRYEQHLTQVRDLLSLRQLFSVAKHAGASVVGTPREVLHTLADLLFDSEPSLTDEEVAAAVIALASMRQQLHNDALNYRLPPMVFAFFREQLDLMDRAVRDYSVIGAAAFRVASLEAVTALAATSPVLSDVAGSGMNSDERTATESWLENIRGWWRDRQAAAERKATRVVLVADLAVHLLNGGEVALKLFESPMSLPSAAVQRQLPGSRAVPDVTATLEAREAHNGETASPASPRDETPQR